MKKVIIIVLAVCFTVIWGSSNIASASTNEKKETYVGDEYKGESEDLFTNDAEAEDYGLENNEPSETKVRELESQEQDSWVKGSRFVCFRNCSYNNKYSKDSYENNNKAKNAYNLGTQSTNGYSSRTKTVYGNIHDTGKDYSSKRDHRDVDNYKFTITEKYKFEVTLSNIPYGQDYELELYKVNKKPWPLADEYEKLNGSYRGGNSSELIDYFNKDGSKRTYIDNATYVIRVYSYKGVSNSKYKVQLKLQPWEDRYEDNDSMSRAKGIYSYHIDEQFQEFKNERKATLHSTSDKDFFKFDVEYDKVDINIHLKDIPKDRDYDIKLYNSSGGWLASSTKSGNSDEHISKTLDRGRYYIEIYSYRGYSPSLEYKVRIEGIEYQEYNLNSGVAVWEYNSEISDESCYTHWGTRFCGNTQTKLYISYELIIYLEELIKEHNITNIDQITRFLYLDNLGGFSRSVVMIAAGAVIGYVTGNIPGALAGAAIAAMPGGLDALVQFMVNIEYTEEQSKTKGVFKEAFKSKRGIELTLEKSGSFSVYGNQTEFAIKQSLISESNRINPSIYNFNTGNYDYGDITVISEDKVINKYEN